MKSFDWAWLLTRRFWGPILRSLFLLATGAQLLALYLRTALEQTREIDAVLDGVGLIWFILLLAQSFSGESPEQSVKDPGPAVSGTIVVLVCGLGAALAVGLGASSPAMGTASAMIVVATLALAVIVYRFASRHAHEIGEARFDTRSRGHRDD